jgi:hypothetical protein
VCDEEQEQEEEEEEEVSRTNEIFTRHSASMTFIIMHAYAPQGHKKRKISQYWDGA